MVPRFPFTFLHTNFPSQLGYGIIQGSAKGGACPLWGATEPFGGGNEGLLENLHLFRIYGSPDGTNIVTVLPGDITAQPGRAWQETAGSCSDSLCFVHSRTQ